MHVEKSVSKFVREILEQDPSLVHELQQRKTAQREIAKRIKTQLIKEGNFISKDPVKLEGNVAVAITRYLKKLRIQQEELLGVKLVQDILKKGTTEVTDGLKHYKIRFHEDTDIHEVLRILVKQLERNDICSVYLNNSGSEFYVKKMAEQSFLDETEVIKAIDTLKLQDSLSLLKLMLPTKAQEIPGILAHVSSLLADQAISIYDTMVQHTDHLIIIFVINEQNASKARDILLKLNNDVSLN
ncbi:MAG: ACT domain-containing protein [Candidatus Heimdallarchaeota archaeon]|nr:MAG: ACT domain-containing protein [Candidatus Heimdallarchaeota archaeon]